MPGATDTTGKEGLRSRIGQIQDPNAPRSGEASSDQAAGGTVDAAGAVPDHRDLVLDPLQHHGERALVRALDRPPGLLITERLHQIEGRLRTEQVDSSDLDRASERPAGHATAGLSAAASRSATIRLVCGGGPRRTDSAAASHDLVANAARQAATHSSLTPTTHSRRLHRQPVHTRVPLPHPQARTTDLWRGALKARDRAGGSSLRSLAQARMYLWPLREPRCLLLPVELSVTPSQLASSASASAVICAYRSGSSSCPNWFSARSISKKAGCSIFRARCIAMNSGSS